MAFSAPSLTRVCVAKIAKDIRNFCYGTRFEDLGRFKYIVGPFDNLCKYVDKTPIQIQTPVHSYLNFKLIIKQ